MRSSDECYKAFMELKEEIQNYPLEAQTEADTRARIIDRMLGEVLDWPPASISREEYAHPGYMDYVLMVNRKVAVLEAKKSGDTFRLPHDITSGKSFSLNGIIRKVSNLQSHINQVTNYCFNNGIEYAIVSNGLQYVIFRAVRVDGIHVGQGKVIVFSGFDDIDERFIEFWELLSRGSVESNSLQRTFSGPGNTPFQYRRVADQLHTFKDKVTRNRLSAQLEPLIAEYMGELTDDSAREKLKQLFVRSKELVAVLEAVGKRMSLGLSETIKRTGRVVETDTIPVLKASIETKIRTHVAIPRRGEVALLLGRVGAGKSTFVNHFLRFDLSEALEKQILVLLDFRLLEPGGSVRDFFYGQLRSTLARNEHYTDLTAKQLRQVYAPEIRELSIGPLAVLERQDKKAYEAQIADFLLRRYEGSEEHYPRVLRFLADKLGVRCFVVFDNVDQHGFDLQQEIFQFAHSFSAKCHAFSLVTMWEETYLRSKKSGGALAAYQTVAYTFPPVSVVDILVRRLEYIVSDIQGMGVARQLLADQGEADDVADFLGLVSQSLLHDKRRARHFLEAISMGNLRRAMEVFSLFLVSGHTDTGKILSTYRLEFRYLIALHEFIKSVGLGDYRFYHSELSQIVNVFSISDEARPSHFTKIRLLKYLYYYRNHTTTFGLGFIRTELIGETFRKFGTSETDIGESLKVLSEYLLVENDTYSRDELGNAYRVTPAGRYFLRILMNKFTYLDLVCQDTPIADKSAFDTIRELVDHHDLDDRFTRVAVFVNYLLGEEQKEHAAVLTTSDSIPLRQEIMPELKSSFESDKAFVKKRRRRSSSSEKTPYETKSEGAETETPGVASDSDSY